MVVVVLVVVVVGLVMVDKDLPCILPSSRLKLSVIMGAELEQKNCCCCC